jgi:hypothetical protein
VTPTLISIGSLRHRVANAASRRLRRRADRPTTELARTDHNETMAAVGEAKNRFGRKPLAVDRGREDTGDRSHRTDVVEGRRRGGGGRSQGRPAASAEARGRPNDLVIVVDGQPSDCTGNCRRVGESPSRRDARHNSPRSRFDRRGADDRRRTRTVIRLRRR